MTIITVDKNITVTSPYVERGSVWIEKATELMKIKQIIKEYEVLEAQYLVELKKLSEDIPSCGGNFVFDCTIRKGTINYAIIPELKNLDLEQYRKEPVVAWKLSMQLNIDRE